MRYPHLKRVFRGLLAAAIVLAAIRNAHAQNRLPLQEALKQINRVFGTNFVYDQDIVRGKTTSYDVKSAKGKPLEEVLKGVLYPEGLVFLYVKPNYYTIVTRERIQQQAAEKADTVAKIEKAEQTVGGRVLDKNGNAISGVTVVARGTTAITQTGQDGRFEIKAPANGTLGFSSIGYEPQDIKIKGTGDINVVLVQSSVNLEEVVVVGYGSEKKEDLTSAVSTVKSPELNENHSSTAVSDMLAGRLPGLYVQRTTGTVGGGSDLKVRGLSTFNNSDPLIVIDGIPDRSLDDLSPTDIDAISVLKDASAIAVYGARAANGVILVTTKRGKAGRPEISFSSTLVDQMPTFMYKKGSSYDYATLQNEAYNNEGSYNPAFGMGFTPDQVALYKSGTDPDHYPNTDWVKELTDGHILQSSYNLSASGGGENVRYFLSAGYVTNGGFVPVEYYKRWNVRSNIDANITKNLKVNLNLGGVFSTTNGEGVYGLDYVIGQALTTPPIRVNRFTNGFYAYVPEQRGNAGVQADGQTGFNTTYNNTLNGTLNLQWDIPWIKGLSVVGTGAYDKGYVFGKRFAKPFDQYSIDSSGNFTQVPSYPSAPYLSENFTQNVSLTLEGSLRYANAFGKHHVSALLLYTQTQDNTDLFSAERQNFVSGALPQLDLGDPSQSTNGGNATLSTRQGIVGRATYDYDSRYLLEFSFRDDGSDIFPPGHRFGFFPAVSGGWVISREPFFKNIKNLDFLKLRGSWGELGNDRVAPYQFLTTYSLVGSQYGGGGYTFGGSNPTFYQSLQPGVLANPNFTWERAIMTDIGLEAHYKGDLVTFEADWFHKRTRDILAPPNLQVPSVIGASLPDFNDGIVDNTGFELTLGHHYHVGKVGYYVEGNMSFNHDKIVYYPESLSTPPWQKITGTSVGGFFNSPYSFYPSGPYLGYKAAGLYQTAQEVAAGPTPLFSTVGPGDIKYVDVDKDGAITANDEVVIGNKFFPGIQYGVRFGANFKGIECNVLLQGSTDVRGINQAAPNNLIPAEAWMQDRWTPEHTNASFPRLWINYQENAQTSTYWVVNTAYMRVKNLEIAYNLPHKLLNRAFKSIRVAVSGNNLITFTKFKWYDPESFNVNNSTGDVSNPLMKSLTAGLTVQF